MSKKNHNNSTSIEDETTRSEETTETSEEQSVDITPSVDENQTEVTTPVAASEETSTEEATVKTDTETVKETSTEETQKTDTASVEETVATAQTVIPPAQKVDKNVTVNLASSIEVRYTQLWSNKRTAFLRNMPLYNIINTYIHNRGCFIGLTNSEILAPITDFVMKNPITVEGIKLSDEMKSDFIIRLKSNTDYCKVKWGYK